jgi:cytochrome P450
MSQNRTDPEVLAPKEPDFFLDPELSQDPYPYYEYLRAQCPVRPEPHHGAFLVTGYEEALVVAKDVPAFSACNAMTGPFSGFPGPPGDVDVVSELIERTRGAMPLHEYFPTFDPPLHTAHRGLLMRLLTPKRVAANEASMARLADRQIDEFVARGTCEFIGDFSNPFVNLVICDLLGVPESDLPRFREEFDRQAPDAVSDSEVRPDALAWMNEVFTEYVDARRRQPGDDILTALATATFPDGSLPEVIDVVRVAAFLFAAGGETTARLLASALRFLAEDADLQDRLRQEPALIPNFLEEVLRVESPLRAVSRIARARTTVAGVPVPAGSVVTLLLGAANRDARRFDCPQDFDVERPNARENLAFGRGIHACPGAPMARAEGRVALERILERLADIRVSEAAHGPAGDRRYEFTKWYLLRGPMRLQLEFTPANCGTV